MLAQLRSSLGLRLRWQSWDPNPDPHPHPHPHPHPIQAVLGRDAVRRRRYPTRCTTLPLALAHTTPHGLNPDAVPVALSLPLTVLVTVPLFLSLPSLGAYPDPTLSVPRSVPRPYPHQATQAVASHRSWGSRQQVRVSGFGQGSG